MKSHPLYIDGLVGPTHYYGGLSFGNRASMSSRSRISSPKQAALQGLLKMKMIMDMGGKQAILPPHARPDLQFLHECGYKGHKKKVLNDVIKSSPSLLLSAFSSSFMWVANIGVLSPSFSTGDGKVHITPANLGATVHRHIEPQFSAKLLKMLFKEGHKFVHHDPVVKCFSDEGAANRVMLSGNDNSSIVTLFVYGRSEFSPLVDYPKFYPARQTKEAIEVNIRNHQLNDHNVMIVQQSPQAIDAGVFHNDVISFGSKKLFICHDEAFVHQNIFLPKLLEKFQKVTNEELHILQVSKDCLTLDEVVDSYFFNSQFVETVDGRLHLLLPERCKKYEKIELFCKYLVDKLKVVDSCQYVSLDQSMGNGGGPACLRIQINLTKDEHEAVDQRFILTPDLYMKLENWINTYYRDELHMEDFQDHRFVDEVFGALDKLTGLLGLGHLYFFQH